jgi:hypothetical protein
VLVPAFEVLIEVAEKQRAGRHQLTRDARAHLATVFEGAGGDDREGKAVVPLLEGPIVGSERTSRRQPAFASACTI